MRSSDEDRAEAIAALKEGAAGAGLGRRKLIRNSLLGALAPLGLLAIIPLRDLGPLPGASLAYTAWGPGKRLVTDPTGRPIKAADVPIGGVIHVQPEGVDEMAEPDQRAGQGDHPGDPAGAGRDHRPEAEEVGRRRDRGLLQGLHPRGLPGRALRAADPPPALPVPPVHLRRHRRTARSSSARRPGRCRSCRWPSTARATSCPARTSKSRSAPASGNEGDDRWRSSRQPARSPTSSTSGSARRTSSSATPARSSRTTGRSCWARSRSTASSSCC